MPAPSFRPPPPPPPADMPRCRRACGRLVWFTDTGLCAACDTKPRKGRKRNMTHPTPPERDDFEEWWEQMRAARGKAP